MILVRVSGVDADDLVVVVVVGGRKKCESFQNCVRVKKTESFLLSTFRRFLFRTVRTDRCRTWELVTNCTQMSHRAGDPQILCHPPLPPHAAIRPFKIGQDGLFHQSYNSLVLQ
jgi:hypothetical protein